MGVDSLQASRKLITANASIVISMRAGVCPSKDTCISSTDGKRVDGIHSKRGMCALWRAWRPVRLPPRRNLADEYWLQESK